MKRNAKITNIENEIKVGKSVFGYCVEHYNAGKGSCGFGHVGFNVGDPILTTRVEKIIDPNHFETKNTIYEVV